MKIYIAGPMTGLPEWNHPAFNAAAAELRTAGHEVVNPAEMGEKHGTADEINADPQKLVDLILEELDAIATCDAIYLLPGWEKSPGTRRELEMSEISYYVTDSILLRMELLSLFLLWKPEADKSLQDRILFREDLFMCAVQSHLWKKQSMC